MALSLFYTIQDSIGEMSRKIISPMYRGDDGVAHRAAHIANDRFVRLREDTIRLNSDDYDAEAQKRYYLEWESKLEATLLVGSEHCKALVSLLHQKLRQDIAAAGIDLPPYQPIQYDPNEENVKLVLQHLERLRPEQGVETPVQGIG